jgi:hypothetical protein
VPDAQTTHVSLALRSLEARLLAQAGNLRPPPLARSPPRRRCFRLPPPQVHISNTPAPVFQKPRVCSPLKAAANYGVVGCTNTVVEAYADASMVPGYTGRYPTLDARERVIFTTQLQGWQRFR